MASIAPTAPPKRPGRRRRLLIAAGVVLLILLVALGWRIATEPTPPTVVEPAVPTSLSIPGRPAQIAWPRGGSAAAEVQGLGSLGTSGSSRPVPIASVAKVMTAYVLLHEQPLAPGQEGPALTLTHADVSEQKRRVKLDQSTLNVKAGELLTEREALQALLLPSANNIAALVAAHSSGGAEGFIARMNSEAKALGMTHTVYTDPSGFDPGTVSTPADQLKLARAVMRLPVIAAIVDEQSVELPVVGTVPNINHLVGHDGYVGVKTGSDEAAGGCLMFAKRFTVGGRHLLVLGIVLGQREGALVASALASAKRLGDSAAAAVRVRTVLPEGAVVATARSSDGNHTSVALARPLREIGWPGMKVSLHVTPRTHLAELSAGAPVASVTARGTSTATAEALTTHALGGPSLGWRLEHVF